MGDSPEKTHHGWKDASGRDSIYDALHDVRYTLAEKYLRSKSY